MNFWRHIDMLGKRWQTGTKKSRTKKTNNKPRLKHNGKKKKGMKKKIMNDYFLHEEGISKVHTSSKHKTSNATQETMKKRGKKRGRSTMPIVNKGNNIKHQQHRETTQPAYYSYHNTVLNRDISMCNFSQPHFHFRPRERERNQKKNCASMFQLFHWKSFYFVLQFWIVWDCGIMHIWSCSYWFSITKHPSWGTQMDTI